MSFYAPFPTEQFDCQGPSKMRVDPNSLKRRPGTLVLPPLPYALALYAGWYIDDKMYALPLHLGVLHDVVSWTLIGLGLSLFAWTLWVFWRHRTTVNPYRAATRLVVDGPFRFSRNPIYLGDWLIYAGVMVWLQTAWPLLLAPLVWATIRYGVIRHEERHLAAVFGDEYRDFQNTTRRWI
jgi:protein-S-isoprenylcysteine O-methyltransferase Ste14